MLIKGIDFSDQSGFSVSTAGDVDGDGRDDILIGAPYADPDNVGGAGETYLVFGSALEAAGAGAGVVDLASLVASDGVLIKGIDTYDFSGFSVSNAGDVDGDGRDDILIGARLADPDGRGNAGESYLVFGAALEAAASPGSGELDLFNLSPSDGVVIKGIDASDESGRSVSNAGDVDGDGRDDILIGAPFADPDNVDGAGETYLVFGAALEAAASGSGELDLGALTSSDGVLIKGIDASDQSGVSVSNAGDVDGDGRDDILIGARGADPDFRNFAGETYLVFGAALEAAASAAASSATAEIGLASLAPVDGVLIKGASQNDRSGRSVSNAGDVDGDGRDDILIGAYLANPPDLASAGPGAAYLVFGAALEAAASPGSGELDLFNLPAGGGVLIKGIDEDDRSGLSVSSAGDVDGDGRDDILIGAPLADPENVNGAGETYLVFGTALEAAASGSGELDLRALTSSDGVRIEGINASDESGFSVSNAGDVDGDGRDDILIGAPRSDPDGDFNAGETYVVSGALLAAEKNDDGVINLADGNLLPPSPGQAALGVLIKGDSPNDYSGISVSNAGDVDGDGRDDVLIGALGGDPDFKARAGETYLVFGSALEVAAAAAAGSREIDLRGLAASEGVLIKGAVADDRSGTSVSNAGDIDGDGRDDILIGAFFATRDGQDNVGEAYVVFGSALEAAASAAGSGATAEIDLANLAPGEGVVIKGIDADDLAGWSVSNAGDVDGDGRDDVLIGAYRADTKGSFTGETYLVFGAALEAEAAGGAGAEIDLSNLAAGQGVLITGASSFDSTGYSLSNVGDVDGDGLDDILIGADSASPDGKGNAGETYLVFGSALGSAGTIDLADLVADGDGVVINGADVQDDSGLAVSGAGDVDGDGRDDLLIAAPGAELPGARDGEVYVVFGSTVSGAGEIEIDGLATRGDGILITGVLDDGEPDPVGVSVAAAGDVDGDGLDDILIGSGRSDPDGKTEAGESYLIFGSTLAEEKATGDRVIDLGTLSASQGVRITGINASDLSGRSVSGAGDVDRDGRDDIIIGARDADPDGRGNAGESYVLFGSALAAEKQADGVIDLALITAAGVPPTATNLNQTVPYVEDPGGDVALGDIVVSDSDIGETITATLTLADPPAGALTTGTFGSATATYDPGSGVWSVSGTVADVNAALAAVAFTPAADFDVDTTITTRIRDAAGAGPADGAITLDVTPENDEPSATNLSQNVLYTEDPASNIALADIVVSDPDTGDTITATLTLFVPAAGSLTMGTFGGATSSYDAGTGEWTVSGTVTDVNAALAAVSFVAAADFDVGSSIATRIRDAAGTGPDGTITLGVTPQNDEPTATNLNQMLAFSGDDASVALDDIVVSDPDTTETITATLALSDPAAGSLTTGTFGSATSVFDAGTGVWSIAGSVADVNAALAAVAFEPDASVDEDVSIASTVRDAADTGPAAGTIDLDFTRSNVAPMATNLTRTVTYLEDAPSVALVDIVVTDPDPGEVIFAGLKLNNPLAGELTTGTFGAGAGAVTSTYDAATGDWEVTGTVADVNDALADVAFLPVPDFDTNTFITSVVADSFDEGPQPGTITLDVTPQDDPAVVTGDFTGSVTEGDVGEPESVSGTLTITDVDTGDTPFFADVAATVGDNGFGSFTLLSGTWTYILDQAAVQFLDTGESVTDTTTFTATDNTLQQVTITVDGTNEEGFLDKPVVFQGSAQGDRSGFSVSRAGDVDGDGLDGLLIAAPGAGADAGATYLVFGAAIEAAAGVGEVDLGGLAGGAGVLLRGVSAGDGSGTSVSAAGDVDGDGKEDILIGAPYAASGAVTTAGQSYLLFGAALEAAAAGTGEIDLLSLTPSEGVVLRGADQADQSGQSVVGVGDVDGDGRDDILIGAPLADQPGAPEAGEVYLVYGKALDAEKTKDGIIDVGDIGAAAAAAAAAAAGVRINGANMGDLTGFAVSGAGDIDGDGRDDILVSAYLGDVDPADPNDEGVTYLVFSSVLGTAGALDLDDLEADEAVQIRGAGMSGFSGRSIASLGDIDGMGSNDVLIGAPGVDPAGETYLVFGEALLAAASDDGVFDLADLVADGAGVVIRGIDPGDDSGFSVSSAGDVDGDGLDDVLIGALSADQPGSKENAGEAYLVYGSALASAAAGTGVLDLAGLAASEGVLVKGVDAGDQAGFSVSAAGDVDGDGLDDVLIGAPFADTNPDDAGETYLLSGARLSAEKTRDGVIDLAVDEGFGSGIPTPIGGGSGTVFVLILGRPAVGSTLTAFLVGSNLSAFSQIAYSWQVDGQEIGTGRTFDITADEAGRPITVVVSYTDAGGQSATVESDPTEPVVDVLEGTIADDTLTVSIVDTVVDGGAGVDTVRLPLFVTAYNLEDQGSGEVTGSFGDQTLVLNDVELLEFGTGFQTTIPIEAVISGEAQEQVGKLTDLYLAFFGRAPDIEGLEFWQEAVLEAGLSLTEISELFAQSEEFQSLYPAAMTNREFVSTIYNNAFDRDPDGGGWDYWTAILDATDASDLAARGAFVSAVVLGAYSATSGPRDEDFLSNRHEVALSYLNRLLEQPEEPKDDAVNSLLQLVTDDDATVTAAENLLDFVFEDMITLTGVMTDQGQVDGFFG